MGANRAERVAPLIHREFAERLRGVKDYRLTPISITRVEVTRDLSIARVWWMPLGGGEISADLEDAVDDAAKRLRGPIGRALRLRHAPELDMRIDNHTDEAFRVNDLLEKISVELREKDEGDLDE
jgi:ribosome-binding factor A